MGIWGDGDESVLFLRNLQMSFYLLASSLSKGKKKTILSPAWSHFLYKLVLLSVWKLRSFSLYPVSSKILAVHDKRSIFPQQNLLEESATFPCAIPSLSSTWGNGLCPSIITSILISSLPLLLESSLFLQQKRYNWNVVIPYTPFNSHEIKMHLKIHESYYLGALSANATNKTTTEIPQQVLLESILSE